MNPFARRTYGTLERVTERVYLFRNIVNSVIVLGDEAVAVIDTQVNAPMAERLVQQVRTSLTNRCAMPLTPITGIIRLAITSASALGRRWSPAPSRGHS